MNRNRKGVMPEITRAMYKDIKKYDRQQFTGFCTDLYGYGDSRTEKHLSLAWISRKCMLL